MQPLAIADQSYSQSYTNLSRSISLTILNQSEYEVSIEMITPRDPNLIISPMNLQQVTPRIFISHNRLFDLYYVNITSSLAISVHFEIHPLNINIGYLFIYKFDSSPLLNSSVNQIDDWILFCPTMTNDSIDTYFINNKKNSWSSINYFWITRIKFIRDHQCLYQFFIDYSTYYKPKI